MNIFPNGGSMKESMKAAELRMLKAGKYVLEEIVAISGISLDEVKKRNADKTA